jgi:hypothetical protein
MIVLHRIVINIPLHPTPPHSTPLHHITPHHTTPHHTTPHHTPLRSTTSHHATQSSLTFNVCATRSTKISPSVLKSTLSTRVGVIFCFIMLSSCGMTYGGAHRVDGKKRVENGMKKGMERSGGWNGLQEIMME